MTREAIYSIYHGRFPGERAATFFAAKEAESFGDEGIRTHLLVPRRLGRVKTDPYEYFHVKKNFEVVYLPTIDLFGLPVIRKIAFPVSLVVFGLSAFFYLLFRASKNDLVYSNESFPLLLATFSFPNTLIAVHDFPERKKWFYQILFRRVTHILSTNKWKKNELIKQFPIPEKKIVVIPNAVDVEEFALSISKEKAREMLGLPKEGKYVVYTGHLYSWKGVDTLGEAAKSLPEDIQVLFVGGREGDIQSFTKRFSKTKQIRMVGQRPHKEIPLWQCAGDILVLPNTAKEEISLHYTSPMKLFEYMASGRPIVASRIPSITEILDDTMAILVPPDDASKLAKGILSALEAKTVDIGLRARDVVLKNYTWTARATQVLGAVS